MKMTKEIDIINVYNENVTINPIEYNIALKLFEEGEENSLLMDKIIKLLCKLYNEGVKDVKEDPKVKELLLIHDNKDKELKSIREKLNYWYCGIDNLDKQDIKQLEKKYPRRFIYTK